MRPARAATWLFFAAAVLAINDHVLKGSALPIALTGKLSDIAGLIAAPALVAVVLRALGASTRAAAACGTLAVGSGFTALQLSSALAGAYDHAYAHLARSVGLHGVASVADAQDLLALPALLIGHVLALRLCIDRDWAARLSLCASALACGGTSVASGRVPAHWGFIHRDGTMSVQGFAGGSLVAWMGKQSSEGSFEVGLVARADSTRVSFDPSEVTAELAGRYYTPPVACATPGALNAAVGEAIRTRVCFLVDMAELSREGRGRISEGVLRIPLRAGDNAQLVSLRMTFQSRVLAFEDWRARFP